ncbi:hypothetical protein D3C87_1883240 [compost metagenome]
MTGIVDNGQKPPALVVDGQAVGLQPCGQHRFGQAQGAQGIDAVGRQGQEQSFAAQLTGIGLFKHNGPKSGLVQGQGGGQTAYAPPQIAMAGCDLRLAGEGAKDDIDAIRFIIR